MSAEPYADSVDHLLDELERLDLVLQAHLRAVRDERQADVDARRGGYIEDEAVDELLSTDGSGRITARDDVDDPLAERIRERTDVIRERKRASRAAGRDLRLVDAADTFGLSPRDVDALLLALAPEVDRAYETIYSYLHDDATEPFPTVGLVLDVICDSPADRLAGRTAFAWHSPLRRHGLVRLSGEAEAPLLSHRLSAADRVVEFLLQMDAVDEALADLVTVREPTVASSSPVLTDEQGAVLDGLSDRLDDSDAPSVLASFPGRDSAAAAKAVGVLCTEQGRSVLRVDAAALEDPPSIATGQRLVREARLRDAAVHVANAGALTEQSQESLGTVLEELDAFEGPLFLTGHHVSGPQLREPVANHQVRTLQFPTPPYEIRRRRWEREHQLPADIDTDVLAATYHLTGGQMDAAVETARAESPGRVPTQEALRDACRAQSTERLGDLAQRRPTQYTWDDIVLPADTRDHLREVAARITSRGRVFSEWGFEEQFSLGTGLTALFTGPSGTGKTMAAEVIAGEAGLDLYRVDLASVVDKYIGETESKLGRLFDDAEHSDALLLFDEADALLGKRSEIHDAHDRHANVQVDYLLQRVEEHDGPIVLTTNFEENIDDAFTRRIDVTVDFPRPDERLREDIWHTVLPEATPVGALDYDFLATFELTGGEIENVVLTAAFMAAEDGSRVEMAHVVRALGREFQKTAKLIAPDTFGEYATHLPDYHA